MPWLYSKLVLFIRTIYWRSVNSRLEDAGVGGVWRTYRDYASYVRFIGGDGIIDFNELSILDPCRSNHMRGGVYRIAWKDYHFTLVF